MVQQPQHHNKHLPAQHTSILRKSSRFFVSNANSNDSNESSYSTSPRPSTGQKVKGLWSPSVSVEGYQEDNHDILAETETAFRDNSDNTNNSHGCLSSPTTMTTKMTRRHSFRTIATTTSTTSTSLENVRDETLSCIFCYLPLADLLRAGRVSRRWRHEVHRNNQPQPTPTPTPILHLLWETVDATSFVEETYDSFLNIAKERHRESESKENIISPLLSLPQLHHYFSPPTITITKKPKHKKQKRTIQDPSQWARVQTGLALGRVLRSKTTAITAAAAVPVPVPVPVPSLPTSKTKSIAKAKAKPKPFAIRSLVLRNVGNKLSPDRLDDFLPASVLSSLRELTLEGFENLNDTHVHVLLLTALGKTTTTLITTTPATTARARATTTTTTTRGRQLSLSSSKTHRPRKGSGHCLLEALVLENCPKLTSKVLSSIAATCSHKRLRKLSLRGCPRIDSITALSDLLVTKLVVLDTTEKRSNGNGNGDASIEKEQGGTKKLATAPPRRSALPRPKSGGVASLFAPPTPQPPNSLTKPKPAGVASLFAPPPPPPPPQSTYTSNRVGGERSSSPSKSSLASLFDLPGTSPTRMNNAESIRILPPPPPPLPPPTSLPSFGTKAAPPPPLLPPSACSSSSEQQQQQQQQRQHPIPPGSSLSMAKTVSKRYHRHQRSLSNGKLPYPPGLLLVEDVQIQIPHPDPPIPQIHTSASMGSGSGSGSCNSTSTSTSLRGSATVVGSLKNLDLRGTAVTPSGLANCLWALTHHQNHHHPSSSADHSWCKVWFEALHLGATALFVDGSQSAGKYDDEHNAHNNRHQHQHQHQLWTSSEDLARLETVLAMDEMEGETSSEGVSYYLTPGSAQS